MECNKKLKKRKLENEKGMKTCNGALHHKSKKEFPLSKFRRCENKDENGNYIYSSGCIECLEYQRKLKHNHHQQEKYQYLEGEGK